MLKQWSLLCKQIINTAKFNIIADYAYKWLFGIVS